MHKRKKYRDLTKIVEIRQIEKLVAAEALFEAQEKEKRSLSDKQDAQVAFTAAQKDWEDQLLEGGFYPTHLEYYANKLIVEVSNQKTAEAKHSEAVDETVRKTSRLQVCDVIERETKAIKSKFFRKIMRDYNERVLSNFEDRFGFEWSRKS